MWPPVVRDRNIIAIFLIPPPIVKTAFQNDLELLEFHIVCFLLQLLSYADVTVFLLTYE